jgi:TatD DNase family protein
MIDTHCHLTFPDYTAERMEGGIEGTLDRAREAGVVGAITVSTTTASCGENLAIAERFDNVWCTAGVHPLYSDHGPHDWEAMRRVGEHPRCVAWGELGLDNHYDKPLRSIQDAVLAEQLTMIAKWKGEGLELPVVVHCREAFDDLIPVLRGSGLGPSRFVFHCFTGDAEDARKVLDFGAWISFTGVVTYKNAKEVQDAAKLVPGDRILVETDAPFLTPTPHRGVRPNEPRFARVTAEFLADLRGESWGDFHAQIDENTRRFFGIEWGE